MSDFGSAPPPPPPSYGMVPPPGFGPPAPQFASMGQRFLARLLDGVILGVISGILGFALLGSMIGNLQVDSNGQLVDAGAFYARYFAFVGLSSAIGLLYEIGLIATRGATIGKQVLGLRVVREDNGAVPGFVPALLRWLIPFAGGFACGIGQIVVYLSPFWDGTHRVQGWHDKVAKTLVVRA